MKGSLKKIAAKKNSTFVLISVIFLLGLFFLNLFFTRKAPEISKSFGALEGDIDGNGTVNILDLEIFSLAYGKVSGQPGFDVRADLFADSRINSADLQILVINYGRTGPTATRQPTIILSNTPTNTRTPTPTAGQVPTSPPVQTGTGIWISQNELMSKPTTGSAWSSVYTATSGSWGTADVSNQDSDHDQKVLAGALVCARTGEFCDKTKQGLLAAIGTESGARWLAIGRNLTGYTIATDIMKNSGKMTGTDLSRMNTWLADFLTRTLADNNSGVQETLPPFESGSNASAQQGTVAAAIAAYTNNTNKLNWVWNKFRLYSCDRTNNPEQTINVQTGFNGGWSHTTNYNQACAINPKGTTKNGVRIDGAIINDMVRGGNFAWPPGYTQYPWVGLEGYIPAAYILQRAGFPAFQIADQAPLRAAEYLLYLKNNTSTDWWDPARAAESKHLVNFIYGTNYPVDYPTGGGRVVGYTDWTHPR